MPEALASRIAAYAAQMPELADLTSTQIDAIANAVAIDELKDEMRRAMLAARTDWQNEAEAFLSDKQSIHTRKAYETSLGMFFAWLERKRLSPADITPRLADDFIRDLRAKGKDADSCRLYVAGVSSFYTFLERRFDEIKNPFRGTKARPKATWKTAVIPSQEEIETIIESAEPLLKAALVIIAETGMRIGGLYSLAIKPDGTMVTLTKGTLHIHPEKASTRILEALREAKLDTRHPFGNVSLAKRNTGTSTSNDEERFTAVMKTRLARHVGKRKEEGKIKATYSFHDFRHAFADRNADKGLLWIQQHLGQTSLAATEKYMRNVLGKDTRLM